MEARVLEHVEALLQDISSEFDSPVIGQALILCLEACAASLAAAVLQVATKICIYKDVAWLTQEDAYMILLRSLINSSYCEKGFYRMFVASPKTDFISPWRSYIDQYDTSVYPVELREDYFESIDRPKLLARVSVHVGLLAALVYGVCRQEWMVVDLRWKADASWPTVYCCESENAFEWRAGGFVQIEDASGRPLNFARCGLNDVCADLQYAWSQRASINTMLSSASDDGGWLEYISDDSTPDVEFADLFDWVWDQWGRVRHNHFLDTAGILAVKDVGWKTWETVSPLLADAWTRRFDGVYDKEQASSVVAAELAKAPHPLLADICLTAAVARESGKPFYRFGSLSEEVQTRVCASLGMIFEGPGCLMCGWECLIRYSFQRQVHS